MTRTEELRQALKDAQAAQQILAQMRENSSRQLSEEALKHAERALNTIRKIINKNHK
jgi:Ni,Fe-hydrogenase maturation factor